MKKLTKIQRKAVYKHVLATFKHGYGVCIQLRTAAEELGYLPIRYTQKFGVRIPNPRYFCGYEDLKENWEMFPEFTKQKPATSMLVGSWWPIDDDFSRIEALKAAIKLCK